jgi:hypothetical protein
MDDRLGNWPRTISEGSFSRDGSEIDRRETGIDSWPIHRVGLTVDDFGRSSMIDLTFFSRSPRSRGPSSADSVTSYRAPKMDSGPYELDLPATDFW